MDYPLCERCGLDPGAIGERLRLLELDQPSMHAMGRDLHERIIAPNVDEIADRFYDSLAGTEAFNRIFKDPAALLRLRAKHKDYLMSLGINFDGCGYVEERLRIGSVHQRAGVPQSLYQCTYHGLQSLLLEYVSKHNRGDTTAFEAMLRFILKITALDMSLAVESYCTARVSGLMRSLESERGESDRLRKLAVTDWLTSLHNHSYSRRFLEAALQQAQSEGSPLCVIMADLDHFKDINDRYGHLVGDEILKIAAGRMVSAARSGDEICRYGGEEFVFILQDTTLPEGAEIAERIRARIEGDSMSSGDARVLVTVSLGLAEARDGDTVNSLIERADGALYVAKTSGRNCVQIEQRELVSRWRG